MLLYKSLEVEDLFPKKTENTKKAGGILTGYLN